MVQAIGYVRRSTNRQEESLEQQREKLTVEQWFGILQRKRLAIADFADKAALAERLLAFIAQWNQHAHPFNWTSKSVAKVMAKCERKLAA